MTSNAPALVPHIADIVAVTDGLVDWGPHQMPIDGRSHNRGRLLFKGEDGLPEAGLWRSTPGSWRLILPADELCYFVSGRARYTADDGEVIEAGPGTLAHFKEGWRGRVEVFEDILVTYMLTAGGPRAVTPVLRDPAGLALDDWGAAQTLDGRAAGTRGLVISREADGRAESGLWECDAARRAVTFPREEFVHILAGSAVYTQEDGAALTLPAGSIAFFPAGWTGICETRAVTRKIYMNR